MLFRGFADLVAVYAGVFFTVKGLQRGEFRVIQYSKGAVRLFVSGSFTFLALVGASPRRHNDIRRPTEMVVDWKTSGQKDNWPRLEMALSL